ncbi:MAG: phytanoyl-CoA dioxygenase family protein [Rhizonema sp. PD38]|nr:phytanoyl-CoA dioxygenase family protein [Rhizonema sp. PD38]
MYSSDNVKTQEDWYLSANWIDADDADIDGYVNSLNKNELPKYDLREKLHDWNKNGVVIFKDIVDTELIQKFTSDLEYVLNNNTKYTVLVDGDAEIFEKYRFLNKLSTKQINQGNIRLSEFHNFSYHGILLSMIPEAISFLSHIFRSQPSLLQSLTFKRGSEQDIHQDFPYVYRQIELAKLAACWIPLEDVHEDSGPLQYYCGSHKVNKVGFFDWGNGSIIQYDRVNNTDKFEPYCEFLKNRIDVLGLKPERFLPNKGDLLIWHGALIHEGTEIKEPKLTRKSFVCHYTPLHSHFELKRNKLKGGFAFGIPAHHDIRDYQQSNLLIRKLKKLKDKVKRIF